MDEPGVEFDFSKDTTTAAFLIWGVLHSHTDGLSESERIRKAFSDTFKLFPSRWSAHRQEVGVMSIMRTYVLHTRRTNV